MEKILDIIESIAHEKGLEKEKVKEVLKNSVIKTAKHIIGENKEFEVDIDEKGKNLKIYKVITVLKDDDDLVKTNEEAFISLTEALKLNKDLEVEDKLTYEYDFESLGRTASSYLYNEIEYNIRILLEETLYKKLQSKLSKIVSGRVIKVDDKENTYIEIDEVRAILPMKNRIKGESFKVGDLVKAILKRIHINKKDGIHMELSRTSPKFLEELLALEVPEIADGIVSIEGCARIPGERAKLSLISHNPNVDPIGATVGVKGVRINSISQELKNESIDCIEYSPVKEMFIARSLSPALVKSVLIKDEVAVVTLNSDQKSKAIGRNGTNVRLASLLTKTQIELNENLVAPSQSEETSKSEENKPSSLDSLEALFNK